MIDDNDDIKILKYISNNIFVKFIYWINKYYKTKPKLNIMVNVSCCGYNYIIRTITT